MKKGILIAIASVLIFALAACGSTPVTSTSATETTNTLSAEGQLLIGTLKLEGTDRAVTAEQAATLLPLWQALQSLSNSDTTAVEELDAIVKQIKTAMTSDQIDSITAMGLTQSDLAPYAAGLSSATPEASSVTVPVNAGQTQPQAGGMGNALAGGAPSGGSAPADMGGGSDVASLTGSQPADITQSANTDAVQSAAASMGVPTAMIGLVIELLQSKIG